MIRELTPADVAALKVQPKQAFYKDHIQTLAEAGQLLDSFTYIDNDEVQAIVGMQTYWRGRSEVWALIGNITNWVKFHKSVKSLMESYAKKNGTIRLEMTTEIGFLESERWAKMLGFSEESLMQNFGVDGKDCKMWVKLWHYH